MKDAVGQEISIKNSKGKVTTKTYSNNVADLFAENNFATADDLSDITDKKFAVAEFENYNIDNNQENLITFAK